MATEKQKTDKNDDARKTKKATETTSINPDKTFTEREHGRRHDSPKTKVDPRTL